MEVYWWDYPKSLEFAEFLRIFLSAYLLDPEIEKGERNYNKEKYTKKDR